MKTAQQAVFRIGHVLKQVNYCSRYLGCRFDHPPVGALKLLVKPVFFPAALVMVLGVSRYGRDH